MQLEYKDLLDDEIKELKIIFEFFDYDKSGTIDSKELKQALKSLGDQR